MLNACKGSPRYLISSSKYFVLYQLITAGSGCFEFDLDIISIDIWPSAGLKLRIASSDSGQPLFPLCERASFVAIQLYRKLLPEVFD
jgi:hypothetical protein